MNAVHDFPSGDLQPLSVIDPIGWQGKPVPPRRWLVPGWLPLGAVTGLNGDGGVGKSLIVQMLMTSCAVGALWLGTETMPCRTFGIFCEDEEDELHRRQAAINQHMEIEMGDLENMLLVSRVGEDNIMVGYEQYSDMGIRTPFFDQVLNRAHDFGAQLVVIDTAADVYGGNENYRNQVRAFINLLRVIALELDGAVLLNSHPSQAGLASGSGTSGSTGWNNTVRSRLYLTRPELDEGQEPNEKERVLKRMKANYAGLGDEIKLTWRDGVFQAEDEPAGVFKSIARAKAENAFMDALAALAAQGRNVSESRQAGNFAPKIMLAMSQTNGVRRRDLERAMEALFHAGRIRCQEHGPPSKRRRQIEIVNGS